MRGKIARALRKEVNFSPRDRREYVELELTRVKNILSYNHEKKAVQVVQRPVSVFITECTDGARNFYQYLKKKWVRPWYEMELNQLPEVNELAQLAKNIITDTEVVEDVKAKNKTLDNLTESKDSETTEE